MASARSLAALVPTYNRETLIVRALESVFAQSRPPDEIIVVDDGSSDNTEEVVAHYGDRVRYLKKENGGVSSARNFGVEASRSDFIAFLDSDDIWYEDHLARIDRAIEATGASAGVYFSDLGLKPPRRHGTIWAWSRFAIEGEHELQDDPLQWLFRDVQPVMIQAAVVSRDAYLDVGGCEVALSCREDTHLFFKLGLRTTLCAVAGLAGLWTSDSDVSLTSTYSSEGETYWRCTELMYRDVLDTGAGRLTTEQRRVLNRRLGEAHWMLARTRTAASRGEALGHLGNAIRLDPTFVPRRLVRRFANRAKLRSR
jgi:glycosyltransferase involved in cell wall biosynthesis